MTSKEVAAFFTLYCDLDREGPGEAADVLWALNHLAVSGAIDVLDAGCGSGADMVTLAKALPAATILGIEKTPHFVNEAQARLAHYAPRARAMTGDMATPGGPFDLIWCAGALYFLGITEALQGWRSALKAGGSVVFSEPVLLGEPTAPAIAFWQDYPQITDLDGIVARVEDAGFVAHAHRIIVGAPWAAYYVPLQARIDRLHMHNPDARLKAALDESQLEIDRWRAAPDQIAYALLIVSPK